MCAVSLACCRLPTSNQRRPTMLLLWDLNASGAGKIRSSGKGRSCCPEKLLSQILFPGLWLSEIMPNSYKVPDIHEPGKVTDLVLQYSNAIPAIDHGSATINGKRDLFEAVCTQ
ncbi:hypothetical protein NE237_007323 [Protea cynaroides]|uniref:Uncharacterized protein n=1 Tax=Protea cynaroides TaxID=273540 RepID=A0A9Q0KPA0_9MAGN|nr:hypothetical protein NE237_007323 [Protea cynaroides]